MVFMLMIMALSCGGLCYMAAILSGLPPLRWALLGTLLGPAILPLFMAQRRWSLVRARGLNDDLMQA